MVRRAPVRHVRVPAPRVDQLVQRLALIRQRPRLQCLLERGTLPGGQILGRLPLARPRGRLLGRRGGIRMAAWRCRAGAARRLSAPYSWQRGAVVPCQRTPSKRMCYDVGR